jgi:hypothetical protein
MTNSETRGITLALARNDHAYLGLRPADAIPTAPCALLAAPSLNSLQEALIVAGNHWPQCTHWDLIASDALVKIPPPNSPPRVRTLKTPVSLTTFTT